jgi:hypothetical protein
MGAFDPTSGYDAANHHERLETKQLNKRLLGCGDAHSLSVLHTVGYAEAAPLLLREMTELVANLDARHPRWGFKDPRTCLTIAVWDAVLPEYRVVGIYRHPLEVWHHYTRSKRRLRRFRRGFGALSAWHLYNTQLLVHCEKKHPSLLLEYGRFMQADESLARLARFLGIASADLEDVREPGLYRARRAETPLFRITRWLQAMFFHRDVDALLRALEQRAQAADDG